VQNKWWYFTSQNSEKNIIIVDTIDKNKERHQDVFCHQEFEVIQKQLRKYIVLIHHTHAIKIVNKEQDYTIQTVLSCGISEI